jgi:hypothetical protein
MFSGYNIAHPSGGSGLARWQQSPTPSAQALAQGTTPQAPAPSAPTPPGTQRSPSANPVTATPGQRAAQLMTARQPSQAPQPMATLRPPPAQPPPTSIGLPPQAQASPAPQALSAPPFSATAPAPMPVSTAPIGIPTGWVGLGSSAPVQQPRNIDGTSLSGAQLAALAGTGLPGDPFTGGFAPTGGWNAGNGGRSPTEQAAAVAAYKAQYGDPGVTLDQVRATTSNDAAAIEAARVAQQQWQDSVGRFL